MIICFDEELCYEVDIQELNIDKLKQDFYKLTGKLLDEIGMDNFNLIKNEGSKSYPTNGLVLLSSNY